MSNRNKLILGVVTVVLATFLLTSVGYFYLLQSWSGDALGTLRIIGVMKLVKARYVEDVPVETLMNGAIKGIVNSLGDPHSIYMEPKLFKEFMIETEGSFGGVGIVIGVKDKVLTVVSPIEGTPGDKAGIKSGDQIMKIDGQDTKDMALDEAVSKIRGPEGTQVALTLRRNQEVKEYTLIRSNIQIKTVTGKMLPGDIGYIRLSMFNENTGSDFSRKYQELEKEGMKSLILDLRDNPGGLLEESAKVAGKLVPKGPIVSVVQRSGQRDTQYSSLETLKYPLVVLVNGGSASASEIVAGAVQDTGAGTLVGTKTFGKGSVQTIQRLGGNTAIKLTIAKYYTPNDRSINGIGIEPDVKVEAPENRDPSSADIQLDKAVEIIKNKK
ncbi:MAG: S41 family peptidase [Negativicutes bacterium]|nr:S41 family peptidase [Negativicutes bacterium]